MPYVKYIFTSGQQSSSAKTSTKCRVWLYHIAKIDKSLEN